VRLLSTRSHNKVRALFAENKVHFARVAQLCMFTNHFTTAEKRLTDKRREI